jgi:serine/threonine protein phosphatase PrpC
MKNTYKVINVVSPSVFGGETKNQDRAVYDPRSQTACVCDGTTSSPFSEKAATIISRSAPVIMDNPKKNLKIVSDYLISCREAAIKRGVVIAKSLSDSMKEFVQEAAKHNLKHSFQSTAVAAVFDVQPSCLSTKVLSCGDSGFFAYSPDGTLLTSNLSGIKQNPEQYHRPYRYEIPFGPGSQLLIWIMGTLHDFPKIDHENIQCPDKWLLCRAVCLCSNSESAISQTAVTHYLEPNELLLVPKYLVFDPKDPRFQKFGCLYYSRFIRRLLDPVMANTEIHFDQQGNTTAVLPDHFDTGQWDYFEERFAKGTHFLLCSDGFYRGFADPEGMWGWLKDHEKDLSGKSKQTLLRDLHQQLNDHYGDDDISFIWITPKAEKEGTRCHPRL